jgi:uncharacterized RDD family membrane protein YckC
MVSQVIFGKTPFMPGSINFKPNLTKKYLATIIDCAYYFIPVIIYIEFFGIDYGDGGKTVNGFLAFPLILYWFIYFIMVEANYGATLGHQAMGLKVIDVNGKKIGYSQAVRRRLCDFIEIQFFGIPAVIVIKTTEKHQRLGDLWANTVVIDLKDAERKNNTFV